MQAAVLDACVLYSALLPDLFMRLATTLYQPKWTEEIHAEWMRNLLAKRPDISREQLNRTRDLMNRNGGDCLVRRYRRLVPRLTLPDPGDRHVLAAAIASKASVIITFNLSDFPEHALSVHGIRAANPDVFASELYNQYPNLFIAAARRHRSALTKPPWSADEYLSALSNCGLIGTAISLRSRINEL